MTVYNTNTPKRVSYSTQSVATVTSAPQGTPTQPLPVGRLVLDDPLQNNEKGYDWANGTWQNGRAACQFRDGTYHMQSLGANYCPTNRAFQTYRYEIQLAIVEGNEGGMIFQLSNQDRTFYYYSVTVDGYYALGRSDNRDDYVKLVRTSSPTIHTGLGKWNTIAIMMLNSQIVLFINGQQMQTISDNHYTSGSVGVGVNGFGDNTDFSTEVMYRNAKVWD